MVFVFGSSLSNTLFFVVVVVLLFFSSPSSIILDTIVSCIAAAADDDDAADEVFFLLKFVVTRFETSRTGRKKGEKTAEGNENVTNLVHTHIHIYVFSYFTLLFCGICTHHFLQIAKNYHQY